MHRLPRTTLARVFPVVAAVLMIAGPASAAPSFKHTNHTATRCRMDNMAHGNRHRGTRCSARARRRTHAVAPKRHKAAERQPAADAAAGQQSGPNLGGLIVGLDANAAGWGGASTAGRLDQVRSSTGARWLREGFLWRSIEPVEGRFDFSYYDHFMSLAAEQGEHILPVLYDAPSWAGGTEATIPAVPNSYATFVAAVVRRYGPHGSFWAQNPSLRAYAVHTFELWNEPYYDNGDNGDYNPGRYANLVKAATTAGRAADASARFLMAAEITGRQVGSRWMSWIDSLYQAIPNLNRYFDGIAIHPYGSDASGLDGEGDDQMRRAEVIHSSFVSHGAANKPFWITEVGWPTCTSVSDGCVTAATQASNLQTLIGYVRGSWSRWVQAAFIYQYEDLGANADNPEDNYGLTTVNHAPKPALAIFQSFAASTSLSNP